MTIPIKPSDAARLLAVECVRDRAIFATFLFLGLRANEVACLEWAQVRSGLKLGEMRVWQKKTKKFRNVTIHSEYNKYITNLDEQQEGFIFTKKRGPIGNNPLTTNGVNCIVKKYFSALGIETKQNSSHALRKTFGRTYYKTNGQDVDSLEYLRKTFGHANIYTTMIYIGVDIEVQAKKVNNISYA